MIAWPEYVNVGGVSYAVEYVADRDGIDSDGANCNLWGQVHYRKHTIRIWTGKADEKQQPIDCFETLLHELLHVIFSDNPALGKLLAVSENEETLITSVVAALADTLVRSKIVSLPTED